MGRKPEPTPACQHRTLASGSTCHIQSCTECSTVSVHLGAVTLRFDPTALESLWKTVGEALLELRAEAISEPGMPYVQQRRTRGDA